ncbi:MAG: phage/plasmid primase, P4 family [Acidobacteriota bacterium]
MTSLEAAQTWVARGFYPIPIPPREKGPRLKDWQELRLKSEDLPRFFDGHQNVGVLLGEPAGVTDIDLDAPETLLAAPVLLPETRLVFGRQSKPASHWFYFADPPISSRRYLDPLIFDHEACMIELRCLARNGKPGLQTVVPPSIHPSGEDVRFERGSDGQPMNIDAEELQRAVAHTAAAALLARHWAPQGTKHFAFLALAGVLARAGRPAEDAKTLLHAIYRVLRAKDRTIEDKADNQVESTYQKHADGEAVTGVPSLGELIEKKVLATALKWLGIEERHTGPTAGEYPLTEIGLAERLRDEHGADLRYCHQTGTWFVWSGRHWAEDDVAEVRRRAKATIRKLYERAAGEKDVERRQATAKFALRADNDTTVRHLLSCAGAEEGIPILMADFDRGPYMLNAGNGVVNLRTGKLTPHARELLLRSFTPIDYDPAAKSPRFERFLEEITSGDRDKAEFLQVAFGYSATGLAIEEKLFMPIGPAATGKSTLLETVRAALGSYAWVADFESFVHRPAGVGGIRSDIAELAGKRYVLSVEVDEGVRLAEGLVKHLTGGDTMRGRQLYQRGFLFEPHFKLWLCANHAPRVRDDDSGLWRRILRIPFEYVVPEDKCDPTLKARLKQPDCAKAVLAWVVEGAIRWAEQGLIIPLCIRRATEEYRAEQDPLKDFLTDSCLVEPGAWVTAADLRKAYDRHCEETGIRYPLGPRQFGERLRTRRCVLGVRKIDGKPTRIWEGIRLLP